MVLGGHRHGEQPCKCLHVPLFEREGSPSLVKSHGQTLLPDMEGMRYHGVKDSPGTGQGFEEITVGPGKSVAAEQTSTSENEAVRNVVTKVGQDVRVYGIGDVSRLSFSSEEYMQQQKRPNRCCNFVFQ